MDIARPDRARSKRLRWAAYAVGVLILTKPGGSGIGLVLSRQIAEAHGGSLTLENRAGQSGGLARLRLPVQGHGSWPVVDSG